MNYCESCDQTTHVMTKSGLDVCTECGMVVQECSDSMGIPSSSFICQQFETRPSSTQNTSIPLTLQDRNAQSVQKEFITLTRQYGMDTSIALTAVDLFKRLFRRLDARNSGIKRCNVRKSLKAACFFYACKLGDCAREKKEVAKMMGLPVRFITKGIHEFLSVMGDEFIQLRPFEATDFIAHYATLLGIPFRCHSALRKLTEWLLQHDVCRDLLPTAVACAVFTQPPFHLTKKEIAERTGNSVTQITAVYKIIAPLLDRYRSSVLDGDGL